MIDPNTIRAAILDMDGVLTKTARIHAQAWKKLFDDFLAYRQKEKGEEKKPFSIEEDYPAYVDGIPRYDGVKNFLEAREIELPFGSEQDEPGYESICALGNKKNEFFHQQLDEQGVETYSENIEAILSWKKAGIALAVISSSKNAKEVLEKADILQHFSVRVDGVISKEKDLKGKPAPDIFLEAARQLEIPPKQIVVVEDAPMGVQAAWKGNFGWVIGFAPDKNEEALLTKGAHKVVQSLKELNLGRKSDPT